MAKRKLIIDTDPGCDDVLGLLLALSSDPEEVELLLISVTYGNVGVKSCLQNVVSTFHVIDNERKWRKSQGLPDTFHSFSSQKPLVAVGAEGPLGGHEASADYYHGADGLGGITDTHPQFTAPASTWANLFTPPPPQPPSNDPITVSAATTTSENPPLSSDSLQLFTPSTKPSPTEILVILASHPPDTVILIALGPLTNFAIAAAQDPHIFLRAKEVLVMGGAINVAGNITPTGEFNILADPLAAARVLALTSPNPASTFPSTRALYGPDKQELPPLPSLKELGDKRLSLLLFPLDITMKSTLREQHVLPPSGSPLKDWVYAFTAPTFELNKRLNKGAEAEMALHDPLVVWYGVSSGLAGWEIVRDQDVRVETEGQWTRGMCVTDHRGRKQLVEAEDKASSLEEVNGDMGGWLSRFRGNRVGVCVAAPGGPEGLAKELVRRLF